MRPSWDEYFLKIAMLVSERSTCVRRHVGAVIVKDKKILTTGYNGAASKVKDCTELGCLRNERGIKSGERHEICRAIHAEQNALIQAGLHGISVKGAVLYCTLSPCILCSKMIVNSKMKKVVTFASYPDQDSLDLLRKADIEFVKLDMPSKKIMLLGD